MRGMDLQRQMELGDLRRVVGEREGVWARERRRSGWRLGIGQKDGGKEGGCIQEGNWGTSKGRFF